MKSITKSLLESLDNDAKPGMTLYDYIVNVCDGEIDMDVSDKDIDMMVAFCHDVSGKYGSEYPEMTRFLNLLAKRTKIVKQIKGPYEPILVCDFSSALKPYNEEWKKFFDMDYSEFDEDEAYYEAVVNLEPLISGNAGESTYKEFCDIMEGKQSSNEVTNEADNMESTIDEAARYLFDEGDSDYLPDYEEFNDSIMEIPKDLFDKAKERALEALTNLAEHNYNDYDGGYGTVLELNDNHTMWELNNENKSDEEWFSIVNSKLAQFKADTGVDLMLLGRSGRHACVEPTYDNCMNFTFLQETQERLEQEAIDEFNSEEINESEDITAEVTYHDEDGTRDYTAGKLSDGRYFLIGQQEQIIVSDKDLPSLAKKDMDDFRYDEDGDKEFIEALESGTTLDNKSDLAKIIISSSKKYLDDGCYLLQESTDNDGVRKKQLINNIEDLVYTYDNGISDGVEEPFDSDDELVDYVYSQIFDQKSDGQGGTRYANGICKDLKYLGRDYIVSEIKRIGHEAGVVKEQNLTESVDENSIANFIKGSVKKLQTTDFTNCKYDLDDRFALYVGWSGGYEAEETNDLEIHSKKNPTYCINAVIGLRNEADWSDLDYINRPYYEAGDIFEAEWTVSPSEDYSYLANSIIKMYEYMLELLDTGELLTEGSSLKPLYIFSNAQSQEGRSDAESYIHNYKAEAPNLDFKVHREGDMWYVDFIGSEEDIRNYLIKLGWFTPEEIDKYDLIKKYTPEHHDKIVNEDVSIDGDPDLNREQVNTDVDYWSDVDEANTEDVSNAEPIGTYTVSNNFAILVYQIEYDINDRALVGDSSDTTKAHWTDIIYEPIENDEVDSYFYYGDIKVPFNEVMRTDI